MAKTIIGKVWVYGDDISTDQIIPGKYKVRLTEIAELSRHAMEGVDKRFSGKVSRGDILVAGRNFGCGSSREHAPLVLKQLGIAAIVARSFARIFYRNAINIGLPVVECHEVAKSFRSGDRMKINLKDGLVKNTRTGKELKAYEMPGFLLKIVQDGGLVKHLKKRSGFQLRD